jgi:glycosyltransferase involved in cell wall biosynthesis
MKRLLVLLPGYNVARHLDALLPAIASAAPDAEICLVDDGSGDGTADRARALGATVLVHERNRGKGEALKTGFRYAVQQGHDAVLTMDADGQHLPAEIPAFRAAFEAGTLVVVGSRMHSNDNMPWLRKRTNEFTSNVISRLAGSAIRDSQSGYRLIATELLARIDLESERYDLESEILIKAGRLGYAIGAVPVTSVYGDQHSSIHPFVDTLRFIRLVWRSRRWMRQPERVGE